MPSLNEINKTILALKNDIYLNELLENNGFVLADIDNREYFYLSELLLNNNETLVNNTVIFLVEENILRNNISSILKVGDVNRPNELLNETYKQILYSYKYLSIKSFFAKNYQLFIPDFDYQEILNNDKVKLLQEAFMVEFDKFTQIIDELYDIVDINKIPDKFLRYLGTLIGFERQDFQLISDISFRELLKNMIEIYRIKGTNFSIELFINFLGFNVILNEYWFDKRYYDNNILINPYTQATEKDSFGFYLTPIKPTDIIPDGAKGKFNKIIFDNEIVQTLNQEKFEHHITRNNYSIEQLLGEIPGYDEQPYTYFKTNLLNYSLTGLQEEDASILTNENLDIINFYIELLTPIFIKSNVSFTTGDAPVEQTQIILDFNDDLLKLSYLIFIGGRHVNTQEGLKELFREIGEQNPGLSKNQIAIEISNRLRNGTLFTKNFVDRDLLIFKNKFDKISTGINIEKSTSTTIPKISGRHNLGLGRDKRFAEGNTINYYGRKEIIGVDSNRIVISDFTRDWNNLDSDDYITITRNSKKGVYKIDTVTTQGNNTIIQVGDSNSINGITAGGYVLKNERALINSYTITNTGTSEFNIRIIVRDPQRKFRKLKSKDKLQIIGDLDKVYEFINYGSSGSTNVTINLKGIGNSNSISRALFLQKYVESWKFGDVVSGFNSENNYLEVIGDTIYTIPMISTVGAPFPVRNFSLNSNSEDSITLSWTAPVSFGGDSVINYRIDVSTDKSIFTTLVESQTETTYTHTGLSRGDRRYYRIYAFNSAGISEIIEIDGYTNTIPVPPRELTITSNNSSELELSWLAPINPIIPIIGYRIDVSTDGSIFTTLVSSQTPTSYTHTGLNAGDTRYYRVYSINSVGTSTSFASENGTAFAVPSVPRNFNITPISDVALSLSWDVPLNNGGTLITGYRIDVSTDGSSFTTLVVAQVATSYTHTGLNAGDTRWYRVYSINSVGTSTVYASGNGVTNTIPSAPRNLAISQESGTILNLSWNAPLNNGGDTITGYRIDVSTDGSSFTTLVSSHGDTSYSHTGLNAGDTRWYRVYSINSVGTSITYVSENATTVSFDTPSAPVNLLTNVNGRTEINLSWDVPLNNGGTLITGYRIDVSTDGSSFTTLVVAQVATSYTHTGLNAGDTRWYRVYSINSVGTSTVYASGNTSTDELLMLSAWQGDSYNEEALGLIEAGGSENIYAIQPRGNYGTLISGSNLRFGRLDAEITRIRYINSQLLMNFNTPEFSANDYFGAGNEGNDLTIWIQTLNFTVNFPLFLNLAGGGYVNINVPTQVQQVLDGISQGDRFIISFTRPLSTPYAPQNLSVSSSTTNSISLLWEEPYNDGGDTITGYRIDSSTDGTNFTTLVATQTGTSYYHTGLNPGDTRYYRVYAINSIGTSIVYASGNTTTDAVRPLSPSTIIARAISGTQISLSWNIPSNNGGDTITGYRIDVSTDGTSFTTLVTSQTGTIYSHIGLELGSRRYYRVYAINSIGTSTTYASVDATTYNVPFAPRSLIINEIGDTIINLSWNVPSNNGGDTITGYRIDVSTDGSSFTTLVTSQTETSYSHTGLSAGSRRYYRVYAINSAGTSTAYTSGNEITDNIPSSPRSLSAVASGENIINLSWNVPSNNGGDTITGYRIDVSTDGSSFTTLVTSQTSTSYSHTGLDAGDTRYYRVYAINNIGTSTTYASGNATTDVAASTIPSGPISLNIDNIGSTRIKLAWSSPSDNGGSSITGYRIDVSIDNSDFNILVISTGDTFYIHTGLNGSNTRYYRVYAINSVGTSAFYASGNATTDTNIQYIDWDGTGLRTVTLARINAGINDTLFARPPRGNTGELLDGNLQLGFGDSYIFIFNRLLRSTSLAFVLNKSSSGSFRDWVGLDVTETEYNGAGEESILWFQASNGIAASSSIESVGGGFIRYEFDSNESFLTGIGASGDSIFLLALTVNGDTNNINSRRGEGGTLITGDSIPSAPINFSAESNGDTSIRLVWDPPSYDGSTEFLGYRLEISSDGEDFIPLAPFIEEREYIHSGLDHGDAIYYRIFSINESGASRSYNETIGRANDVPGSPENFVVKPDSITSIDLDWDESSDNGGDTITGYRIDVSIDNSDFETIVTKQTPTSYTHSELPEQALRYYRVYAINNIGVSTDYVSGSAIAVEIRSPQFPRNFISEPIGDSSIELDWNKPINNGGSPITGYRIDVSINNETFKTIVKSQTPTIFQHLELVSGDTYYYRIYAINEIGISEYVEGYATVGKEILGHPRNLVINGSGSTSIELTWNKPSNDGGDTITGYRIDVSTNGDTFTTLVSSQSNTSYEHTGLSTGDTRWYRVYAINGVGTSASYVSGSATTFTVPSVPRNLTFASLLGNSIKLNWYSPETLGGTVLTGYRIDVSNDGSSFTTLVTSQESTSYTHTGLSGGDTRWYRVYAINGVGTSITFASGNITVEEVVDENDLPGVPLNLSISANGDTRIDLDWDEPSNIGGDSITGYRIDVSINGTTFTTLVASQGDTHYAHTGLSTGDTRWYKVYSINGFGTSINYASGNTSTFTVPNAPINISITTVLPGFGFNITWDAPDNNGGDTIIGYRIDHSEDNTNFTTLVASHDITLYSNLISFVGIRYFRIYAINSVGTSIEYLSGQTIGATPPGNIRNLSASSNNPSEIDLVWSPPINDGGDSITGYRIRKSNDGSSFTTLVASHGDTYYGDTGLTTGDTRWYRVQAINSTGVSSSSAQINAIPGLSVPGSPLNLLVTTIGDTSILLRWSPSSNDGGDTITGYRIDESADGISFTTLVASQGDTHYAHTGLSTGDSKWYRVYAINNVGTSIAYASGSAITFTVPNTPEDLGVSIGDSILELVWNPPSNTGGDSITGYRIEYSLNGISFTTLVNETGDTHYTYTGLSTGDTRWYRVYAINGVGTSATYAHINAVIEGTPFEPEDLDIFITGINTAILVWNIPSNTGGLSITGYRIDVSINGTTFTTLVASHGDTSYEDTGLSAGDSRWYRVYAINSVGTSTYANYSATTSEDLSPILPIISDQFEDYDITINLTLSEANYIGNVNLVYSVAGLPSGLSFNSFSRTINGNLNESGIFNIVYTITDNLGDTYSTSFDFEIVPVIPSYLLSVTVNPISSTMLDINWPVPGINSIGGDTISNVTYSISRSISSSGTYTVLDSAITETEYGDTGLLSGTIYYYRIYIINSIGIATSYLQVFGATLDSVPDSPINFVVTEDGRNSIYTVWDAPSHDGGDTITGYRIDVSIDGTNFTTLVTSQGDTSYTHTGLDPGDNRWYRVYAINSVGTSAEYASGNATTEIQLTLNDWSDINGWHTHTLFLFTPEIYDNSNLLYADPLSGTAYGDIISGDATLFNTFVRRIRRTGDSTMTLNDDPDDDSILDIVNSLPNVRCYIQTLDDIEFGTQASGGGGDTVYFEGFTAGIFGDIANGDRVIISILSENVDPELNAIDDRIFYDGTVVSFSLPEATTGNPPITYSATGFPTGLIFNNHTRIISGTYSSSADAEVTYTAVDDDGDSVSVTFNINEGITMDDWVTPAGDVVEILALIEAEVNGGHFYRSAEAGTSIGVFLEGDLDLGNSTISRIRPHSTGENIILNDNPDDDFISDQTSGFDNIRCVIQTEEGIATAPEERTGGGYIYFNGIDNNDVITNIETGDRFIIAIIRDI